MPTVMKRRPMRRTAKPKTKKTVITRQIKDVLIELGQIELSNQEIRRKARERTGLAVSLYAVEQFAPIKTRAVNKTDFLSGCRKKEIPSNKIPEIWREYHRNIIVGRNGNFIRARPLIEIVNFMFKIKKAGVFQSFPELAERINKTGIIDPQTKLPITVNQNQIRGLSSRINIFTAEEIKKGVEAIRENARQLKIKKTQKKKTKQITKMDQMHNVVKKLAEQRVPPIKIWQELYRIFGEDAKTIVWGDKITGYAAVQGIAGDVTGMY